MPDKVDISNAIKLTAIQRGPKKSTCPSEIARMLFPNDWWAHMKDIVEIAIDLQTNGEVMITQKGQPVDINHIKGPIRIKLPDHPDRRDL